MAALPESRSHGSPLPSTPTNAACWQRLLFESEDAQLLCDRGGVVWEANRKAEEQFVLPAKCCLFKCGLLAPGTAEQLRQALSRPADRTVTLGTLGISCPEGVCVVVDLQLTRPPDRRCPRS